MKVKSNVVRILMLAIAGFTPFLKAPAASMTVNNGGNLQAALDQATNGDTITLQAGATFTGNFTLHGRSGTGVITLTSSAASSFGFWNRVSPSQASSMARLLTPNDSPALGVYGSSTSYYHLVGLEISGNDNDYVQDLIRIGFGSETSNNDLPHDIDIDQCYIHAGRAGGKRGIALNGNQITVENSYVSAFVSTWQDTQTMAGWNSVGPFQIINNRLESGTEILAFGGAVPSIVGNIPSNAMILTNDFSRPGSDYSNGYLIKNFFESKFGRRMNFHSNTFDSNLTGEQQGVSFSLPVRTEYGQVYWAANQDFGFTNNFINNALAAATITGHDDGSLGGVGSGYFFRDNLFLTHSNGNGGGRLFTLLGSAQNIDIIHNTAPYNDSFPVVFDLGLYTMNFNNNIVERSAGVAGNGQGEGNQTLANYVSSGTFLNNVLIGVFNPNYPASTSFSPNLSTVGFNNPSGIDFRLSASSPYRNAGTDGLDIGANTSASTDFLKNEWVMLVSKNDGYCIQPDGQNAGANVVQFPCYDGLAQMWKITPVSGGYKIINRYNGLALQKDPAQGGNGARLEIGNYGGSSNQVWSLPPSGHTWYFNLTPNSDAGKTINVPNATKVYAQALTLYNVTSPAGAYEEWAVVPAPTTITSFPGIQP